MSKFDSKSFNPTAFGTYVKRVKNLNQNALIKSRAIGSNEQAKAALSSQTGSVYATIPYFGRINGSTSQNNDGSTDITSTNTTTYEQGFVVASRMDGWTERTFSKNITAGVDFMSNVAAQIKDYKFEVQQSILLATLKGIFAQGTTGTTKKIIAARSFVDNHTLDITAVGDGLVGATSMNTAVQKAGGDNKNSFKLSVMHSVVATDLENIKVLEYLKYTDADGITQDLALATWNGRTVLIDDNMPTELVAAVYTITTDTEIDAAKNYFTRSGSAGAYVYTAVASPVVGNIATYYEFTATEYTKYTTYVLGIDSVLLEDIGDAVPYEMSREASKNGGQDTLYVRDRYIVGVDGLSFVKPADLTVSATNAQLETGANWEVIGDGTNYISHKAIPVARIISRG